MWTESVEELLLKWSKKCEYFQLLYLQASADFERKDRYFGIPIIILGTITTSTIFLQLDECNTTHSLISGGMSFLLTLVTGIGKYVNYHDRHIACKYTSDMYGSVAADIQEQLCRPRACRLPAIDFLTSIKSIVQKLETAPMLPHDILNKYLKDVDMHLKTIGISTVDPGEIDQTRSIDILQENRLPNPPSEKVPGNLDEKRTIIRSTAVTEKDVVDRTGDDTTHDTHVQLERRDTLLVPPGTNEQCAVAVLERQLMAMYPGKDTVFTNLVCDKMSHRTNLYQAYH